MALTRYVKGGLGLFAAGAAVFLIAFFMPYWGHKGSQLNFGLWHYCNSSVCNTTISLGDDVLIDLESLRWTQAWACFALIGLCGALVTITLYLCGRPRRFLRMSMGSQIVTVLFAFLSSIVFGRKINEMEDFSTGWGFVSNNIGGILLIFSSISFFMENCCGN